MSRRLREIVIPFRYRYIQLNKNLLELSDDIYAVWSAVWSNVRQYTRHIVIDCELDWYLARELLFGCTKIERIEYAYIPD
jgi:hypothetical protein